MTVLPLMMFCAGIAVAIICWREVRMSSGVAGMGEGSRATVASPVPAAIQRVLVRPYEVVAAGQPLAVIQPNDPRVEMDLIQSEMALARLELQPTIAEDNAMNFEQLRVDLLKTKAELGMAKVNLELASKQVRRNEPLYREKLVSEDIYDISVNTRDVYAAEVFEKSNAVAQIEKRFAELEKIGLPQMGGTNFTSGAQLSRLRGLQAAATSHWGALTLRAPAAGMITSIWRRDGENVQPGEPLLTISSAISERVVGYLRQPYPVRPDVGMDVTMVTRERQPRKFAGVITEVGAQVEIITNALAMVRPGSLVDAGLPIIVSMPPGAPLRPGEIVDMTFRRSKSTGSEPVQQTALR